MKERRVPRKYALASKLVRVMGWSDVDKWRVWNHALTIRQFEDVLKRLGVKKP